MPLRDPRPLVFAALAGLLSLAVTACAGTHRLEYTPTELEEALRGRLPPSEVVVPYAVTPAHAARIQHLLTGVPGIRQKVELIVSALYDPAYFGLKYRAGAPGTAEEAFARGGGDCLALASAFIGLARAAGLEANYIDASVRIHETQYLGEETAVNLGHITAAVKIGQERFALDFEGMGKVTWYRVIDDAEAVAHLFNNRGYALLDEAQASGRAPDWAAAGLRFRQALSVKPEFARAWNNLGIAETHLGRVEQAISAYRRAISLDGTLAAARANLGGLYLARNDLPAAQAQLDAAARIDPGSAHAQYALALVRLRTGDRAGAREALERAVALRTGWKAAEELLSSLRAPGAG
jgi:tetratricopeptide (TPR) repeat protein